MVPLTQHAQCNRHVMMSLFILWYISCNSVSHFKHVKEKKSKYRVHSNRSAVCECKGLESHPNNLTPYNLVSIYNPLVAYVYMYMVPDTMWTSVYNEPLIMLVWVCVLAKWTSISLEFYSFLVSFDICALPGAVCLLLKGHMLWSSCVCIRMKETGDTVKPLLRDPCHENTWMN